MCGIAGTSGIPKQEVLIIGASGFLGTCLTKVLGRNYKVEGTYFTSNRGSQNLYPLNTSDMNAVLRLFKFLKPDVVINAAAISDPDYCETHKFESNNINYLGTKNVVVACKKVSARLIHFSSSYVFDGEKENYTELDRPNPINQYGKTKLKAEREVAKLKDSLIIRMDLLYGFNGIGGPNGFIAKILEGAPLKLNDTQVKQPVWIKDVAIAVAKLIKMGRTGILNLGSSQKISKYNLARDLEKRIRSSSILSPSYELKRIAPRPKNSTLDVSLAKSLGIRFTDLDKSLKDISKQIKSGGFNSRTVLCQFCGKNMTLSEKGNSIKYICAGGHAFYPVPTPAVAAIIIKKGKILLAKREMDPNSGKWALPSGFVEFGEEPDKALIRELKEELGINVQTPRLLSIKIGRDYPAKLILGIYYVVSQFSGKIKLDQNENSDFRWFDAKNLPTIAFKTNNAVLKAFVKKPKNYVK